MKMEPFKWLPSTSHTERNGIYITDSTEVYCSKVMRHMMHLTLLNIREVPDFSSVGVEGKAGTFWVIKFEESRLECII